MSSEQNRRVLKVKMDELSVMQRRLRSAGLPVTATHTSYVSRILLPYCVWGNLLCLNLALVSVDLFCLHYYTLYHVFYTSTRATRVLFVWMCLTSVSTITLWRSISVLGPHQWTDWLRFTVFFPSLPWKSTHPSTNRGRRSLTSMNAPLI
jgi:hypothetical protein